MTASNLTGTESNEFPRRPAPMTYQRRGVFIQGPPNHVVGLLLGQRLLWIVGALLTGGGLVWRLFGR